MVIATKTLFQTEDGKTFESEIEAKAHEVVVARKADIEKFLDHVGVSVKTESGRNNPRRTQAMNMIASWLAYSEA